MKEGYTSPPRHKNDMSKIVKGSTLIKTSHSNDNLKETENADSGNKNSQLQHKQEDVDQFDRKVYIHSNANRKFINKEINNIFDNSSLLKDIYGDEKKVAPTKII